jgi:hypothetical protein
MSLGNLPGNLLNSYKTNFPEVFSQSARCPSDSMLHDAELADFSILRYEPPKSIT